MRKTLMGALVTGLVATPLVVIAAVSATPAVAATSQAYTWKNVAIGGGGFIPGIEYSPAQQNLVYTRTDIGGAYRWDNANSTWVPLLDWVGASNWGYNGVVSLAPDPVDANKVYAAVGMYTNDWDPNNGAILRSSDKGATWSITTLPFKLGGNMPGRGQGERLAIDPNKNSVLYFGAPSGKGLWRSTDSGVTWAQVTNFPNVGNYVQDASNAYTADNQGVTWVTFDKSSGTSGSATPAIYVGVADKNNPVYRSTDGGATWSALAGAPTGYLAHKGVIDTTNHLLYIATSDTGGPYDGAKGDVWKYSTASGTWTQISPIASSSSDDYFGYSGLTIDRQHPGTIMVATQISWWPDSIFFRSTDSGATWTRIWDWTSYPSRSLRYTMDASATPWLNFGVTSAVDPVPAVKLGWMNEDLEIDPFNSNNLLYGTGATLYSSSNLTNWDAGTTLTIKPRVAGLEETAALDLASPPTGAPLISGLGDIGGFVHTDVTKVPSTMFTQPVFGSTTSVDFAELNPSIMVRAGNFTASDRPNDRHAAFSTDGGSNWFQGGSDPGSVNSGGSIAAAADGSRFVWAPGDSGLQVVYSVGFGNTWSTSQGIPANAVIKSDRVNPKKFYGLAGGKFYVSTDGGATFTASTDSSTIGLTGSHFKVTPGKEGDIWLANATGGLLHSTDSGATFTKISTVDAATNIGLGKAAPGASTMALYLVGTIGGVTGAFRSDDAGASWIRINDDQHQYGNWGEAITGDPRIYGRVYIGTNGRGILYADPSGTVVTTTTTTKPVTTTTTTTTTKPVTTTTTTTTKPVTTTTTTTSPVTTTTTTTRPVTTTTTTTRPVTTTTTTTKPVTTTTTRTTSTTDTRDTYTTTTSGGTGKTCSAAYAVTGQWTGGFQGNVTVTAGTSAISGWKVTWTFANGQTISQSWSATVTSSGSAVTATNMSWNGALGAGANTSFGFLASWNGTNTVPAVTCTAS